MQKRFDTPTFDPANLIDIENFNNKVTHMKDESVSDELLVLNLEKIVDWLNKTTDCDLVDLKTRKLIVLLSNLTFKTKCRSTEFREKIVRPSFYVTFKRVFNYFMSLNDSACEHKNQNLAFLISSLNNLTFESERIAKENVTNGIVKMALDCFKANDYLTQLNANQLTSKDSLYLFDNIVRFLLSNSEESAIKQDLNALNIIQIMLDNIKRLDESLKKFPRMIELKIIEVRLICILACLMDDSELEKHVHVSEEIVEKLIQMLNDTIKKSKSNSIMLNTRFYLTYEINLVPTYMYARSIMKRFLNISVNDTIKQIIFDKNGLPPILKLLQSGNDREQFFSSELISSLCFNQNVKNFFRDDKKNFKIIEDVLKNGKTQEVKNNCNQIIEMINHTLEKRMVSGETKTLDQKSTSSSVQDTRPIMISYNSKYKDQCLRLNDELKKRGLNTWIDLEKMPGNLFDGMADAVENASIILICYSEEYRKSANCRLEAEYAFKLNKPMIFLRIQPNYQPQGWIGLLIGQRLYIDFSDGVDINKAMNELLKQIGGLKVINTPVELNQNQNSGITSVNVSSKIQNEKKASIANWTSEDIQNWLSSNDLKEFIPVFHDYSGISFTALWEVRTENSSIFFSAIDAEIKEKRYSVPNRKKILFYSFFKDLFSS